MLRQLAGEVVNTISEVDGVHNATSSAEAGVPQMRIQIDAEKAAQYGLTEQQIMGQVRLHFTGQVASQYREDGDEMDVTLMFPEEERSTISDLEDMKINSPSGATVPLASLADFKEVQGPVSLQRENQEPQVNVSGELGDRDLGSVTNDVKEKLDQMSLPEGYSYKVGGQAEDMAKSFSDLAIALVFSIFLVYAVMAVQFENFLFPFVIMFSLPATVVGVLGGLFITGLPLSIPAFIGVIMLAGIVVNNSIVLVDYINIIRRKRRGPVRSHSRSRTKPTAPNPDDDTNDHSGHGAARTRTGRRRRNAAATGRNDHIRPDRIKHIHPAPDTSRLHLIRRPNCKIHTPEQKH